MPRKGILRTNLQKLVDPLKAYLDENDWMFARVGKEKLSEVRTTGGQNQFVSLEKESTCQNWRIFLCFSVRRFFLSMFLRTHNKTLKKH